MKRLFVGFIIISFIVNGLLPVRAEAEDLGKAEDNRRMGHLLDLYMTESFVILSDSRLSEKISEVADKISDAAGMSDNDIRIRLINDKLPITSSLPGYVFVSTGMLDIIDEESELAYVIAHAIAHAIEKDQYQTYSDAFRNDRRAQLTGQIMPFLIFSGVGAAAVAGAGMTAASASAIEGIVVTESGAYSITSLSNALTSNNIHGRKNIHNLLMPYVKLPDIKQSLSVMVFLNEIYSGYGEKEEIHADNLAISLLYKAGYDPNVIITVLRKFMDLRNDNVTGEYTFHQLSANPGLEKRIDNAAHVLENYK